MPRKTSTGRADDGPSYGPSRSAWSFSTASGRDSESFPKRPVVNALCAVRGTVNETQVPTANPREARPLILFQKDKDFSRQVVYSLRIQIQYYPHAEEPLKDPAQGLSQVLCDCEIPVWFTPATRKSISGHRQDSATAASRLERKPSAAVAKIIAICHKETQFSGELPENLANTTSLIQSFVDGTDQLPSTDKQDFRQDPDEAILHTPCHEKLDLASVQEQVDVENKVFLIKGDIGHAAPHVRQNEALEEDRSKYHSFRVDTGTPRNCSGVTQLNTTRTNRPRGRERQVTIIVA
mmetsp:Transcript_25713/g.62460  ORF Transcript_25713/g.62460 Transcript_25713/m.62460 type:complete len:294 (-) Transcript_25713:529-1410(-)